MKKLIVLGAGGHAKVLVDIIHAQRWEVLAVCDLNPLRDGTDLLGERVTGNEDIVFRSDPGSVLLVNGIGSVGDTKARTELFHRFKQLGYAFATLISPNSCVSKNAEIGEGTCVMQGAVIQAGCRIGDNVIVNTSASVDHDCRVDNHCHIAPGVTISGNVRIGPETHIGCGATVIQGVCIGKQVVVAAGAVVIQDVESGSMVAGVPAIPKKSMQTSRTEKETSARK